MDAQCSIVHTHQTMTTTMMGSRPGLACSEQSSPVPSRSAQNKTGKIELNNFSVHIIYSLISANSENKKQKLVLYKWIRRSFAGDGQ